MSYGDNVLWRLPRWRETRHTSRFGYWPSPPKGSIERDQIECDVSLGDGQLILLHDQRRLVRVHPVEVDRAGLVLGHDELHGSLCRGDTRCQRVGLLLGLQKGNKRVFRFLAGLEDRLLVRKNVGREPRLLGGTLFLMRP